MRGGESQTARGGEREGERQRGWSRKQRGLGVLSIAIISLHKHEWIELK